MNGRGRMHTRIETRVREAVEERVFPGCVVGIIRANGSRHILPFGNLTYEPDSAKVTADTIYDLASITKSIPTASLALSFIAEGRMGLADKVVEHLPELRNDRGATIEDLLRYRVQGTTLSTLKEKTPEEILEYVFAHGFDAPPSGEAHYTNLPAFLLGLIVERVGTDTLDTLAQKYFFDPFGMKDTAFFHIGSYDLPTSVAPTEIVDGQEVHGIVHDESARVFARAGRAVGHAGLFSTVPDILNFLEALLQNDGFRKPIMDSARKGLGWQPARLNDVSPRQNDSVGLGSGGVNDPQFMGKYAGAHTFGKTGFTGTSCVVDAKRGIAFVILSNRTYPKRPPDGAAIDAFRRDIADVVLE